jgi:hypothetical protein
MRLKLGSPILSEHTPVITHQLPHGDEDNLLPTRFKGLCPKDLKFSPLSPSFACSASFHMTVTDDSLWGPWHGNR